MFTIPLNFDTFAIEPNLLEKNIVSKFAFPIIRYYLQFLEHKICFVRKLSLISFVCWLLS